RESGMALKLCGKNAALERGLMRCSARAISSFPVPVSPWIRTVAGLRASASMRLPSWRTGRLQPTRPWISAKGPNPRGARSAMSIVCPTACPAAPGVFGKPVRMTSPPNSHPRDSNESYRPLPRNDLPDAVRRVSSLVECALDRFPVLAPHDQDITDAHIPDLARFGLAHRAPAPKARENGNARPPPPPVPPGHPSRRNPTRIAPIPPPPAVAMPPPL